MFDLIKTIYLLLFLVFTSCGPNYDTKYYKTISLDKQDTASLKLIISERGFYGNYQIKYKDRTIDDGTIVGNIMGDTLLGKYSYLSRGNARLVAPIAFLKVGEKLKLGTGIAGTYMGFHVYSRGSISFNDSLFQFKPIEYEEFTSIDQRR
ncbi:hypothetical protein L0657_06140 [Dyadobacter sp. CY345]|uniref:hypothetical protein n=1 Tax=Dyadobacter sp. CY345 TaxID=2909335 RepID=UPI001F459433|nr:hypothetical protein [Dyadobacter sp. CY345]MCF2443531.1 hypothetical protein [Dyadobacter sp. CY345]